jgi:hypothetical protein
LVKSDKYAARLRGHSLDRADLLAGAVAALLRNVDINLPSIDGDRAGAFAARRREIAEAMTSVRKRVCEPPQD